MTRRWQLVALGALTAASLVLLGRTRSPCVAGIGSVVDLIRARDAAATDAVIARWTRDSGCASRFGAGAASVVRDEVRRSLRADYDALLVYPVALVAGCLIAASVFGALGKPRARRVARALVPAAAAGALLDIAENTLALGALDGRAPGLGALAAWLITGGKLLFALAAVMAPLAAGMTWGYVHRERVQQLIIDIRAIVQGAAPIFRRCSVSLVLALFAAGALALPGAALEILRVLAEDASLLRLASFFLTTLGLAFMSWYWARAMLTLLEPNAILTEPAPESLHEKAFRLAGRHLPRICGVIPLLGAAWAMYRASIATRDPAVHSRLVAGMVLFLLAATGFYAFVVFRRKLFRLDTQTRVYEQRRFRDLGGATRAVLTGTLAVWVAVFGLVWATEGLALRALGAASIISMAVATWIPVLTVLRYWRARFHFPFITALLLVSFVFSVLNVNDNRVVRHARVPRPGALPSITSAFGEWLAARPDLAEYPAGYPVIFVAAEGGGLRAGYHVATILGALQDRCPAFAQHVFAISSVSGGSLGAAVFAGLASRRITPAPGPHGCRRDALDPGALELAVHATLDDDLLSPLVAAGLYTDLVQNLIPAPVSVFDRARALERGFERSWRTGAGDGDVFAEPFDDLWRDPRRPVPYLFLNTTSVETGDRLVVSRLSKGTDSLAGFRFLVDNDPTLRLPLSTAVALSARFPYVTPEGAVPIAAPPAAPDTVLPRLVALPVSPAPEPPARPRFVDGGYFENSGAATLLDILTALRFEIVGGSPALSKVRPIVLRIGFSARGTDPITGEPLTAPKSLNELLAPIRALLNTRDARGRAAVRQLRSYTITAARDSALARGAVMIEFPLREDSVPLVTSWLLSDRARREMNAHVRIPSRCREGGPVPQDHPLRIECSLMEVMAAIDPVRASSRPPP